jgi:YrbI family 3-deoxy-D-manno-octulosonate 8-phosphate phosphatase
VVTIAFIPVRGGSKSIPGKNIRPLLGQPLVHWVTGAALRTAGIDRVVVSSDSEEIRRIAAELDHPRLEVVDRAAALASDTASTESVLIDYAERNRFDRVILIQATSPLTRPEDLEGGLQRLEELGADSLVSVTREHRFRWRDLGGGLTRPDNYRPEARPRRQDWEGELQENGAFYITTRSALLESRCRLSGRIAYWEMPRETAVELDDPGDWLQVEALLRRREPSRTSRNPCRIRLLITDVDGVLTDGGMYYSADGEFAKKFNTRDGMGVQLWREAGNAAAIITKERSPSVAERASKLRLEHYFEGVTDKLGVMQELIARLELSAGEVAYVGDDVNDLEIMRAVGFAACPADAQPEVLAAADFVCTRRGGEGCVREVVRHLLERQRADDD